MGTLADLVQGFQGGYTGVQDARRRRKINKALDYELEGMEQKRNAGNSGIRRLYGEGSGMEAPNFQMPQTYGEKLVGKIKGFFGGSTGQQSTQAIDPNMQQAGHQSSGATTYGTEENRYVQPQRYKDGGAVRSMKRYADGGQVQLQPGVMVPSGQNQGAVMGRTALPMADGGSAKRYVDPETGVEFINGVPQGEVPTSGGGVRGALGDIGRNIGGNTRRRFSEWAPAGLDADQAVLDAEGAANKGAAVRGNMAEGARGLGQVGMGLLEDTSIAPIAKGIGGFLGYGTDKAKAAEAGPGKAIDPEAAAVTEAVGPPAPDTAAQPAGDPPNTRTPQAQAAAEPAGPPDEIIDFTQVRDVMPEDMPNHGVKDWEDERRYWAAQAIAMGNDPFEAMKAVDQRQMRGFSSYGQQAFQMLQAGDATGAARALYAAYQYFPNGANVRFGVQKGKNGQPVLLGMGVDESTGEPIKGGKPMVVTPESLSVQLENMTNPAAFRTWTKDWRTAEQEIREYNEVTKPAAQSAANYQRDMGQAALNRSEADLAAATSGSGGPSEANRLAVQRDFREALGMFSIAGHDQDKAAKYLTSIMGQLYDVNYKGGESNTIINDVWANSEDGTNIEALVTWLESLGIEQ